MSEDLEACAAMLELLGSLRNCAFVLEALTDEAAQIASEVADELGGEVWRGIARTEAMPSSSHIEPWAPRRQYKPRSR
ncbi:hypothetical protein [Methylorubrum sp. GM97]|uniref:hypothetical protein n=1 Tax=Methylorubrum sp. GM97 TaxID=2938232 RepID=UPI002185C1DE|nr:hypothetical protein [Methylorubrum sp. GM97]BDL41783.1 hypothetical protein MSPGM_43730 [Methylorubrum sp. GM97]